MPTIKDIARRSGVSTATVSHVINNTRFVSEELRHKVLASIRDLQYHPNAIARSLVKQKTHTIGVIVSDILNPFYTAIVRGIEDVTSQAGYNVILCNSDESSEKENLYIRVLLGKRIDGLALATACRGGKHPLFSQLESVPLVTIVRKMKGLAADAVFADNVGGAYKGVHHLIELGHRRIGIISGPSELSSGAERLQGYLKALAESRLAADPRLIQMGDFKRESGYALARKLFSQKEGPTGLFVANNQMTLGALQALKELGLRIPEDLSLVSIDDMEWSAFLSPPMTAVEQYPYIMGRRAGEMLLRRIEQGRRRYKKVVIPSKLVLRKSTGPPG